MSKVTSYNIPSGHIMSSRQHKGDPKAVCVGLELAVGGRPIPVSAEIGSWGARKAYFAQILLRR